MSFSHEVQNTAIVVTYIIRNATASSFVSVSYSALLRHSQGKLLSIFVPLQHLCDHESLQVSEIVRHLEVQEDAILLILHRDAAH